MSTAFSRLAQALAGLRQPAAIEKFLNELLTPGELHDIGLRWELVELLVDGVSQRQVASRLGISLCKITRGAKILKKRNGGVAAFFAARPAKAAPARKDAKPSAQKKPATKVPAEKKSAARKPAAKKPAEPVKKTAKKVGGKHGTRVAGKSKNQVRR